MKRFLSVLCAQLMLLGSALATIRYVDGGCVNSGTGTCPIPTGGNDCECATLPGQPGPYLTADEAQALMGCGDVMDIRGPHAAHGSNHKTFVSNPGDFSGVLWDGRYNVHSVADGRIYSLWIERNLNCTSNPMVIRGSGWTAVGTGERPIIESTVAPGTSSTKGWNQCTCSADICSSALGGACSTNIWWTDNAQAGGDSNVLTALEFAQRPDGSPTFRENSTTFAAGLSTQYHSYTTGGKLFVNWGTGINAPGGSANPKPYVLSVASCCNTTVTIRNTKGVAFRGITFRMSAQSGIDFQENAAHDPGTGSDSGEVTDCKLLYAPGEQSGAAGDAHPLTASRGCGMLWQDNEISHSASEGIHTQANIGTACANTIRRIWIHDIGGNPNPFYGYTFGGTANGMIIGDESTAPGGGGCGTGDYTGTLIEGCLIERISCSPGSLTCEGIRLENHADNGTIRDNVIRNISGGEAQLHGEGNGMQFAASAGSSPGSCPTNSTSGWTIYNNIIATTTGPSILLNSNSDSGIRDNKLFNNTLVNGFAGISSTGATIDGAGIATGNLFRNNLTLDFVWTSAHRAIRWTPGGSSVGNEFQNNGIWAQASGGAPATGTLVAIASQNSTCSLIQPSLDMDGSTNGTTDGNLCPLLQPGFGFSTADIAALDLRLRGRSLAVNAGTMTGMPSRTGINNSFGGTFCSTTGIRCDIGYTCLPLLSTPGYCIDSHALPDYTRPKTTNISASPDMGAYEVLLADGDFENSGAGVWSFTDLGDVANVGRYITGAATAAHGLGAMYLEGYDIPLGLTAESEAVQTLTGLDSSRTYRFSGLFDVFQLQSQVSIGPCTVALPAPGMWISFECAFMPGSTTFPLILHAPGGGGIRNTISVDSLELR
jgi:hypothetical protein